MREDMQLRGFSLRTQETYLMRVTHFARYFNKLPDKLGQKEIKEYLLYLVKDKHASYGVLNMTYCALKFIFAVTLGRCVGKDHRGRRDPVSTLRGEDEEEGALQGAAVRGDTATRSVSFPFRDVVSHR
jgi:hypothetical protein